MAVYKKLTHRHINLPCPCGDSTILDTGDIMKIIIVIIIRKSSINGDIYLYIYMCNTYRYLMIFIYNISTNKPQRNWSLLVPNSSLTFSTVSTEERKLGSMTWNAAVQWPCQHPIFMGFSTWEITHVWKKYGDLWDFLTFWIAENHQQTRKLVKIEKLWGIPPFYAAKNSTSMFLTLCRSRWGLVGNVLADQLTGCLLTSLNIDLTMRTHHVYLWFMIIKNQWFWCTMVLCFTMLWTRYRWFKVPRSPRYRSTLCRPCRRRCGRGRFAGCCARRGFGHEGCGHDGQRSVGRQWCCGLRPEGVLPAADVNPRCLQQPMDYFVTSLRRWMPMLLRLES